MGEKLTSIALGERDCSRRLGSGISCARSPGLAGIKLMREAPFDPLSPLPLQPLATIAPNPIGVHRFLLRRFARPSGAGHDRAPRDTFAPLSQPDQAPTSLL